MRTTPYRDPLTPIRRMRSRRAVLAAYELLAITALQRRTYGPDSAYGDAHARACALTDAMLTRRAACRDRRTRPR